MPEFSTAQVIVGSKARPLYFRANSSDEVVVQKILGGDHYDLSRIGRAPELMQYARRRIAEGLRPLIIDAGANIGVSSIYFLANVPNSRVVAIEPNAGNFELLARNVDGLDVQPIRGAISSQAGHARVIDPNGGHQAYRTEKVTEDSPGAVACVTIEHIIKEHTPGYFPFIVKIDVEGAEKDLFSAATGWVERTPLVIIELHDWLFPKLGTSLPFLQCVSRLDRDFMFLGEDVYSVANDLDRLR